MTFQSDVWVQWNHFDEISALPTIFYWIEIVHPVVYTTLLDSAVIYVRQPEINFDRAHSMSITGSVCRLTPEKLELYFILPVFRL